MPEISVDLATTRYGYSVQAGDVFWVRQGILRSTELRDSLDEQAVADLVACVLGADLIERSKEALDDLYDPTSAQSATITSKLKSYPPEKLREEMKYVLELVDKIVAAGPNSNLRNIVFPTKTTNSFPTVFSAIFLAVHELSFRSNLVLADALAAHRNLKNVQPKLNTSRNALSSPERRKNINIIKGLIQDSFVIGDVGQVAFGARRELDIENTLRRSQIETPIFEAKQGVLNLSPDRATNQAVFEKVIQTAVAIANIGPKSSGAIFIGVADNEADANRIAELDGVTSLQIGARWIVGIDREAKVLGLTPEKYYQMWRDKIDNANLTAALKADILSNLDLCAYKDRNILILGVPAQKGASLYNGNAYARDGDQTVHASAEKLIAIAGRFAK